MATDPTARARERITVQDPGNGRERCPVCLELIGNYHREGCSVILEYSRMAGDTRDLPAEFPTYTGSDGREHGEY